MLSGEKPSKRVRILIGGPGAGPNESSLQPASEFSVENGLGNDEESKIEN
jgi:hypothetical protein